MWLKVSYCSAGAYLLLIATIVMKDVYENKGNKDPRIRTILVLTNVRPSFWQLWLDWHQNDQFPFRYLKSSDFKAIQLVPQPKIEEKQESRLVLQSGFCLFAVHVLFLFVRGGIFRSQCFHLLVHFFDGCGLRDSQIQEFYLHGWIH